MVKQQKEVYYKLQTIRKYTTNSEFGTYLNSTHKSRTRWSLGWSPANPMMVTHKKALRLNSQNLDQVTTAMDGHLPFLGWSPANPWMVTYQRELNYRLKIWHLDLT